LADFHIVLLSLCVKSLASLRVGGRLWFKMHPAGESRNSLWLNWTKFIVAHLAERGAFEGLGRGFMKMYRGKTRQKFLASSCKPMPVASIFAV
jgi:hypothetical protein